jgi:ketosteroid isomerase-like protein
MGQWSRAELEEAFHDYEKAVVEIAESWDWARYADQFTEDASYIEHGMGNRSGREEIREWISSTMNMFPGSEMPFFPCEWYAIDEELGWVIARIPNRMKDPGDGSIYESPVITVLKYAGDGKWSYEEDAYNPMNFLVMVQEYVKRSHELGTLSDDGRTFANNMGWQLD